MIKTAFKSILTFILFTVATGCFGQSKVELGVRVILQRTTLRYTSGVGAAADFLKINAPYYSRWRTALGVGIVYNPLKKVRLGADLLYSLQGGGYEERKNNLNYIKLPLWIGYNASPNRKLIFSVQSGIELSYLVRAKIKYATGEKADIRQYVNKISLGIPFAMGVKFKVSSSCYLTTQVYLYTDVNTLSKNNKTFGAYNYIYPGLRIAIDRNLSNFKK
ncbi:MAG: outer membrane beta-barrel protein [Ferruginibacter sp.]